MYKRQEILAFELTKLVHGEEEAAKAKEASHALLDVYKRQAYNCNVCDA